MRGGPTTCGLIPAGKLVSAHCAGLPTTPGRLVGWLVGVILSPLSVGRMWPHMELWPHPHPPDGGDIDNMDTNHPGVVGIHAQWAETNFLEYQISVHTHHTIWYSCNWNGSTCLKPWWKEYKRHCRLCHVIPYYAIQFTSSTLSQKAECSKLSSP